MPAPAFPATPRRRAKCGSGGEETSMAVNSAWGIDVGNRALKAIKLVRDGDGVRVDDFEVIEHENVLSNAGDNREALIQQALASFVQRHAIKGGFVGIGVSGQ